MSPRTPIAAVLALLATVSVALLLGSPPAGASGSWTWPVRGEVITAYHNGSDPYQGGQHRGIDIAAAAGTPVVAAVGGTVRFAGVAGSSGLTVSVRTADGSYDTSYLHLSSAAVREGDRVAAGERVGAVGVSGRRSAERPHVHFGVRDAGSRHAYHDPLGFLPPLAPPTAPEPRGAPAPVRVPVPLARAPEPVRAPVPTRAPWPVRAPGRVRVPARGRVRVPAGRRVRIPAGRRWPTGSRAPVPVGRRAPVPVGEGVASHAPALGPQPAPAGAGHGLGPAGELGPSQPSAAPADRREPVAEPRGGAGPNVGWALACTGLLLAAACLGRPGEGKRGARADRGRAALRSLLRPLLGRR